MTEVVWPARQARERSLETPSGPSTSTTFSPTTHAVNRGPFFDSRPTVPCGACLAGQTPLREPVRTDHPVSVPSEGRPSLWAMPARKPTEVHIRNGTFRPDRHSAPILVGGRPEHAELAEPPDHLPPEAQEFWRTTVVRLVEVGIVDRVDVPLLEQLATQYARIAQARRVIEQFGHFSRGSMNQLKEHPALKIEREATAMFQRLADQFALSPLARARLGVADVYRRSLQAELEQMLGGPVLRPTD